MTRKNLAYQEVMSLHRRDQSVNQSRKRQRDRSYAMKLRWHVFWITTGVVIGVGITFVSQGIWLRVGVVATGIPAYAQEVTDFIKMF